MKKNNIVISKILLFFFAILFSLKALDSYKNYSKQTIVYELSSEDLLSEIIDFEEFDLLYFQPNLPLFYILIIANNYLPVFFVYFLLIMGFFKPPKMNILYN